MTPREMLEQQITSIQARLKEPGLSAEEIRLQFQRLNELRRDLRALDDTPVVPYWPATVPPSAPRGRRRD